MSIDTSIGIDIHTLNELFTFTHALRDHLEQVFQRSEALSKEVSDLTEQALRGQRAPIGPLLSLIEKQADQHLRAGYLLQSVRERAEVLAVQYGTHGDPKPTSVNPNQLPGLLGVMDALSLLQPLSDTQPSAVKKHYRLLQGKVEQLLLAALRGEDLSELLGILEVEQVRFMAHGEGAHAGCECLSEAIATLQQQKAESPSQT